MKKLLIIGMGGHARVVNYVLEANSFSGDIFYLDQEEKEIEYEYLGGITNQSFQSYIKKGGKFFVCAIGNNEYREKFAEMAMSHGLTGKTLIHPSAIIASNTEIGEGSVIFAQSVIHPGTKIGNHVIINTGAQVDHDNLIDDYSQLAPSAVTGGDVKIKKGVMIGMGAIITPQKTIKEWATIGAGAVVTRDIPSHITAWGVPAKKINK